jgi:hypothetical protein
LPRLRSLCVFVLLFPASTLITHGGEKPWTEVRSPNFRVLTNGTAGEGRRVAREFEPMRAVFAIALPRMRLETGAALTIFAPRDEYSMKAMAPAFWKPSGTKPAGLLQKRWERQYAYHECVHSLLHANFKGLPTWLDESLADFYASTRFEQTKMYVGAPRTRVYHLKGATLIKLDELISEDPWRKFRNDDRQIDLFYSE